jgi:hypothetical protein
MTASLDKSVQNGETVNFDLVRLSKSKQSVDLAPNTIRAFAEQGLRLFRSGKMVWFSRTELEHFIKSRA